MKGRKIEAMHRIFGEIPDKRCEDCTNLRKYYYRGINLRKCTVYGETNSEASDWRKKYVACGMFNRDWHGNDIIRTLTATPRKAEQMIPLEGQMTMMEEEDGRS